MVYQSLSHIKLIAIYRKITTKWIQTVALVSILLYTSVKRGCTCDDFGNNAGY